MLCFVSWLIDTYDAAAAAADDDDRIEIEKVISKHH